MSQLFCEKMKSVSRVDLIEPIKEMNLYSFKVKAKIDKKRKSETECWSLELQKHAFEL